MHKRSLIRAAIVEAIKARPGLPDRVFATRARSTESQELPAVIVYALNEESAHVDVSCALQRTVTVVVEVKAKAAGSADLGEAIDDLCLEVEAAIYADMTLGGLVVGLELAQTAINIDPSGDARDGTGMLRFSVLYHTERPTA